MTERLFCVFQFIALTIFGLLLKIINLEIRIKLNHYLDYYFRSHFQIMRRDSIKNIQYVYIVLCFLSFQDLRQNSYVKICFTEYKNKINSLITMFKN